MATTPINNQAQALGSEKPDVWVATHKNVDSIQKNRKALSPRSPDMLLTYYLQFLTHAKSISTSHEQLTAPPIQKNIFTRHCSLSHIGELPKEQNFTHHEKMKESLLPTKKHVSSCHHFQHIQWADYSSFNAYIFRTATTQPWAKC